MEMAALCRLINSHSNLRKIARPLQYRSFQPYLRDPNSKPKKYKYPTFYYPYGLRTSPSKNIIQLAEQIVSLTPEERSQIGTTLGDRVMLPKLQPISVEGMDLGSQVGASAGSSMVEEKKAEKTTIDFKLEKFEAVTKIKVIKEVREFPDLGLKEAKELVEKVPVTLKQQLTKEEVNSIIEKIKSVGGVAVME